MWIFFPLLITKHSLHVSWEKDLYFLILYLHAYSSAFNCVQDSIIDVIESVSFQLGVGLGENSNDCDLLFCIVFLFLSWFLYWSALSSVNSILRESWARVIIREILEVNTCCSREEIMRNGLENFIFWTYLILIDKDKEAPYENHNYS